MGDGRILDYNKNKMDNNVNDLIEKGKALYAEGKVAEAVKVLEKAAGMGSDIAKMLAGVCYFNGDGVEKSYAKAAKLFRGAAENGNAEAQYILAECYNAADSPIRDAAEALKWYQKAAAQGHQEAAKKKDILAEKVAAKDIEEVPEEEEIKTEKRATKYCPYCGEEILAVAKKCKHCGEWLDEDEDEDEEDEYDEEEDDEEEDDEYEDDEEDDEDDDEDEDDDKEDYTPQAPVYKYEEPVDDKSGEGCSSKITSGIIVVVVMVLFKILPGKCSNNSEKSDDSSQTPVEYTTDNVYSYGDTAAVETVEPEEKTEITPDDIRRVGGYSDVIEAADGKYFCLKESDGEYLNVLDIYDSNTEEMNSVKILTDDEYYKIIQPAVNSAGDKITFITKDGGRCGSGFLEAVFVFQIDINGKRHVITPGCVEAAFIGGGTGIRITQGQITNEDVATCSAEYEYAYSEYTITDL